MSGLSIIELNNSINAIQQCINPVLQMHHIVQIVNQALTGVLTPRTVASVWHIGRCQSLANKEIIVSMSCPMRLPYNVAFPFGPGFNRIMESSLRLARIVCRRSQEMFSLWQFTIHADPCKTYMTVDE